MSGTEKCQACQSEQKPFVPTIVIPAPPRGLLGKGGRDFVMDLCIECIAAFWAGKLMERIEG